MTRTKLVVYRNKPGKGRIPINVPCDVLHIHKCLACTSGIGYTVVYTNKKGKTLKGILFQEECTVEVH